MVLPIRTTIFVDCPAINCRSVLPMRVELNQKLERNVNVAFGQRSSTARLVLDPKPYWPDLLQHFRARHQDHDLLSWLEHQSELILNAEAAKNTALALNVVTDAIVSESYES